MRTINRMTGKQVLYVAYDTTEFQLPLYVASSKQEMLEWSGMTKNALHTALYDKRSKGKGTTRGFTIVAVSIDEEDDE